MVQFLSKLLAAVGVKTRWQKNVHYKVGLTTTPFRIVLHDSVLDLIFETDVIIRLRKAEYAKAEDPLVTAIEILQQHAKTLDLTLSYDIPELQLAMSEHLK